MKAVEHRVEKGSLQAARGPLFFIFNLQASGMPAAVGRVVTLVLAWKAGWAGEVPSLHPTVFPNLLLLAPFPLFG